MDLLRLFRASIDLDFAMTVIHWLQHKYWGSSYAHQQVLTLMEFTNLLQIFENI